MKRLEINYNHGTDIPGEAIQSEALKEYLVLKSQDTGTRNTQWMQK